MNARGIESQWIGAAVVALAAALLPGCLPKGLNLDFVIEFDKPLAAVEAAIELPGLVGEWQSRDDSKRFTIESLRAAHLPAGLYRFTERDADDEWTGVIWIVKAGDSLYVNFSDLEDEHIVSAKSLAEWRRTADTTSVIMRLEVEGDTLRMFVMQETAPAVQRMFADGVLAKKDRGVVTHGLREALAAIAGADAFPESQLYDTFDRVATPEAGR